VPLGSKRLGVGRRLSQAGLCGPGEGRAVTNAKPGGDARLRLCAGARVMVVEDESLVAMMLCDMLEDLGCAVIGPTATVTGALALLEGGAPPDLALLDVNLGGENACAVADALARRAVPFIFVSGYGRSGIDPRYAQAPVLPKPFEPATLARAVGQALRSMTEARP
jgi:CheY-like chemotaxis protein